MSIFAEPNGTNLSVGSKTMLRARGVETMYKAAMFFTKESQESISPVPHTLQQPLCCVPRSCHLGPARIAHSFSVSGLKTPTRRLVSLMLFVVSVCTSWSAGHSQSLDVDGQSGVFLQPSAEVIPGKSGALSRPTIGLHTLVVSPVYGTLYHAHLEEGYGNWAEFGYTRSNHTDGSSALVNYEGMNIFNVKVKLLGPHAVTRTPGWMPTISVGGILRTNDPYIGQALANGTLSNGDVYLVGTKLITETKRIWIFANAGVRGTNSQVYGLVGNSTSWSTRAFGALAFPIPIRNKIYIAPAFEIDQEPHDVKYLPGLRIPSTLGFAVRIARLPDSRWSFDVGTGHIVGTATPGFDFKANNAIAIAVDYRF